MKALLLILAFGGCCEATRLCKTSLLRSFGLSSRITANKLTALCPGSEYNCCTKQDQMTMHKTWNKLISTQIELHHQTSLSELKILQSVTRSLDSYNLRDIVKKFVKEVKPDHELKEHLESLLNRFSEYDGTYYTKVIDSLLKDTSLRKNFDETTKLRKSAMCSYCDWHSQRYYNVGSLMVTYKDSFCFGLVDRYISTAYDKFVKLYPVLRTLEEILMILGQVELFEPEIRQLLIKMEDITRRCEKDRKSLTACQDFCAEFNPNKYSYIYDGEVEVARNVFDVLEYHRMALQRGEADFFISEFNKNRRKWNRHNLQEFRSKKSVLQEKPVMEARFMNIPKNTFNLTFKDFRGKRFIENEHPSSPIQLDTFDSELSPYVLYKLADKTIDISNFYVRIDPSRGLNLFTVEMPNFEASVEQLLGMLHFEVGSVSRISEELDESTLLYIKLLDVKDYYDLNNDALMKFDRVELPQTRFLFQNSVPVFSTLVFALTTFLAFLF